MVKWKPIDVIVLILTFTICCLLFAYMYEVLVNEKAADEDEGQRILTFVLALVAVISTYVGASLARGKE